LFHIGIAAAQEKLLDAFVLEFEQQDAIRQRMQSLIAYILDVSRLRTGVGLAMEIRKATVLISSTAGYLRRGYQLREAIWRN
jgi:hypothetical protein